MPSGTISSIVSTSPTYERANEPGHCASGTHAPWPLTGALCCVIHAVTGFTNQSLRGLVAGLLGIDYSTNQMGYDLRKLRLHGLIEKIPGTNTYRTTPEGIRAAVFYTKLHGRLLGPLLDAGHQPPAPLELRRALTTIDQTLDAYITEARLGTAA